MTRIAVYCEAPITAKGLESVLRNDGTFDLIANCSSIGGLRIELLHDVPDIILLEPTADVTFAVLTDLKHRVPDAKIVLWVDNVSTEMAMQAMELGVRGILRKTLPVDLQIKCLQRVHAGELWFEKALRDRFRDARQAALDSREQVLVSLLAQGLKNWEIASSLTMPESALKVHLSVLFEKLGVKDRFELALFGLRNATLRPGGIPTARFSGPAADDGVVDGMPLPLLPTLQ